MSSHLIRSALLGLATSALLSLTLGCAAERDPINRVQANALDKSFFVGADLADPHDDPEFWTQATLTDVGYGAAQDGLFTSTYTQGVARIKWQITEDLLLGRLTYERVADSDHKGVGPSSTDGQVVVAYPILSHFDIRREYNPSTGEELNVITENTTDRPWNERQYFRVDWSKNLNTDAYDFDTLSMLGLFGGVDYEPLAYYVNDPYDKDAPYFDVENGYFDVTNKAFARPATIDLSRFGWGIDEFPACFLDNDFLGGSFPSGNCNPVEITIRQAFRRVVDTDYEPADWDGYRFQAYGGFYLERYGYERNFGMSDDKWHRFLTRYNIWQRSHYYQNPDAMTGEVACYTPETLSVGEDPHADADDDGTEDRCWEVTVRLAWEAGACTTEEINADPLACYERANPAFGGSRCDTFKQRCTLPYRHRQVRPLAWYYTNDSHLGYFEGTEWATHEHDVAMRHAIMVSRYAECMSTNSHIADLDERRELCIAGDGEHLSPNPVYFGQMDDHLEAKQLAKEVDDCRHGLSYVGDRNQENYGPLGSADREEKCVALADSVAAARSSGGRDIAEGVVELAKLPEQIVLCHSPVEANDPPLCAPAELRLPAGVSSEDCQFVRDDNDRTRTAPNGEPLWDVCFRARNVRRGDLRYHLVNVVREPQTPSPWGIYTDAEDPLTGETFSAAINVWSHVTDLFSQLMIDRIRYIKGELSTSEVTEAEYVRDWARASEAANGSGIAPRLSRRQLNKRISAFADVDVDFVETGELDVDMRRALRSAREELRKNVVASVDAASTMAPIYEARRKRVMGTETEAQLITPMMQQLAGVNGLPADVALEKASIFRSINPMVQKQMRLMFQQALAARGTCMYQEAPAPSSLSGLADVLEQKFMTVCGEHEEVSGECLRYYGGFGSNGCAEPGTCKVANKPDRDFQHRRAEAMRQYVAQRAHYAVIAHEMGHSVGKRHNFVSSSDAFGYRPQYWQLRTDDGAHNDDLCTDYDPTGECLGPRYFDPVTPHESEQLIWMWMHSSVMDYAGEYTQDMIGLGVYDVAAHRMFYGENVAVFADPSYRVGRDRHPGMIDKMDNFGGILGIQPTFNGEDIHYTEYPRRYEMISDCQPVDMEAYKPASWDPSKYGVWSPLLDGLTVKNTAGQYTRCRQQKVDYVPYQRLHRPQGLEFGPLNPDFYRGGPAIDPNGRVRVPYGFATDRWADLGNASVYRHDNGADVYEIFNFLATQQEIQHIFDNYRRRRQNFSVKSAAYRTLSRYNEKIRDGAKGLGLLANWYRDLWADSGAAFSTLWALAIRDFFPDNVLASGMVFDHFAITMARPEAGPHYFDGTVMRSDEDATTLFSQDLLVNIPNGATGAWGNISYGGKLVENRLSEETGEYDAEFTVNSGSYYDKMFAPYLMTESVDNFISDTRGDFVNGRYRAVSLADLFPDGYRRWLGNNLTGDDFIKGPRLATTGTPTQPLVDGSRFPTMPIGFTTWWGDQPEACFPAEGTTICNTLQDNSILFDPRTPDGVVVVDPQIGFEQQKFLIAETLLWLPENEKTQWLDMLRMYQLGYDADPAIDYRIELHDPNGKTWVARSFGREIIFGKLVEKGIAARVLQWANELLSQAYETVPVDYNTDGIVDWYDVVRNANGEPIVLFDPGSTYLNNSGNPGPAPANCNVNDNSGCLCDDNRFCVRFKQYMSVPQFLWQAVRDFGYDEPDPKGIWE